MTKKLLLPTRQERRQARQDQTERPSSASSLRQIAFAKSDQVSNASSLKLISEHNNLCERSANSDRLQRWVEDQRLQEALWNEKQIQESRTPPPVPPRPKALLERLRAERQPKPSETTNATETIANLEYPDLPPSPPLTDNEPTLPPPQQLHPSYPPLPNPASTTYQEPTNTNPDPCTTAPFIATALDLPPPSTLRTFTDSSGKFTVSAALSSFQHGHVTLHKANGVRVAISLSKLSGEDIRWVCEELDRRWQQQKLRETVVGTCDRVGKGEAEFSGDDDWWLGNAITVGRAAASEQVIRAKEKVCREVVQWHRQGHELVEV